MSSQPDRCAWCNDVLPASHGCARVVLASAEGGSTDVYLSLCADHAAGAFRYLTDAGWRAKIGYALGVAAQYVGEGR